MSNMSYCRFQNTLADLEDCYDALLDEGLECEDDSKYEAEARRRLVLLCTAIAREFSDEL